MTARQSPQPDIAETLRLAAGGDADAWRTLVDAYSKRLFGLIFRHCGDRELAEEITQDTFVKLVAKLSDFAGYEERGRFEPWLFRIAMNRLRDEMRRRGRQARTMDMGPGATQGGEQASAWAAAEAEGIRKGPSQPASPVASVSRAEHVRLLQEAVASMSEADREILHLRHTAGMGFSEIAEALDKPLGTVLARGHRALKKLRKLMEERGVEGMD